MRADAVRIDEGRVLARTTCALKHKYYNACLVELFLGLLARFLLKPVYCVTTEKVKESKLS